MGPKEFYRLAILRSAVIYMYRQIALSLAKRVGISAGPLPGNSLEQAAYMHVPLSPSSIIWYQPMGGDTLWLGR